MTGSAAKYKALMLAGVVVALGLLVWPGMPSARAQGAPDTPPAEKKERKQYDAPPKMTIDVNKKYSAVIDTSKGKIVVDLFAKDAPKTVNNFVFLAREGFYNGTVFHRVIPDFMIQGGDPTGTGRGNPGYRFEDEVGPENLNVFKTGTLAMANSGPNTNGSQFFITHKPTEWLLGKHTIFGQVREGQDVVNAIEKGDTIKGITIEEK
jgi:peptidyl-prolyl cis-trans isomerase B (cyclophilin B)